MESWNNMRGISPIKPEGSKIYLLTPNPLQQMTTVCIICDIIFIPFAYLMYMANEKILGFMLFLGVFAFAFTYVCFGFKSKFAFDTAKEQMFIEGTNFFVPYKKLVCNFSDIEVMGVQCYEHRDKHGTSYSYDLVYATKQEPVKFKKLATTMGINHMLTFNDINEIGLILSKATGCRFIKGIELRSIQAFPAGGTVKYTMGGTMRRFLE